MEEIVKVTRNYQITIPASIRKELKIREGDKVILTLDENKNLILIKKYDELEGVKRILSELPKVKRDWKLLKKKYYEGKGNYR